MDSSRNARAYVRRRAGTDTFQVVIKCRGRKVVRSAGRSHEAAVELRDKLLNEWLKSPAVGNLQGLVDEYIEMKSASVVPNVIRIYRLALTRLVEVAGPQAHVRDVDHRVIHRLSVSCSQGVSNETARTRLKKVSAFLSWVVRYYPKLLSENPVSLRELGLGVENFRLRFLGRDEVCRVAEFLRGEEVRWLPMFLCYVRTGGRCSEVANLLWRDVDLDSGSVAFRETKTGRDRVIPLHSDVRAALSRLPRASQWVFPSSTGEPLIASSVSRWWRQTRAKTGLQGVRLHDLRHTAISHWVMAGVDIRTVQVWAGHRTLQQTTRYAHLAPDHHRTQMERFENYTGVTGHRTPNP